VEESRFVTGCVGDVSTADVGKELTDSDGKEDAENLRADVKIEVVFTGMSDGREMMKDPNPLAAQRPERTAQC